MNADRSRSRVSSWRLTAASALGRRTVSRRSGVWAVTTPSSSAPAAWMTARSGRRSPSRTVCSAARSAASHATMSTSAPSPVSSARSSGACPVRLSRTRSRTPWWVTRCRARWEPSRPVPPVMRTVPSRAAGAPSERARSRRGARRRAPRTASWSSPATRGVSVPSVSVSTRTKRPGCSDWADLTRPHTAAPARSVTFSSGAVDIAPVVTNARRPGSSSAIQRCTSARAWCTAVRTSPPDSMRTVAAGPAVPGTAVTGVQAGRKRESAPGARTVFPAGGRRVRDRTEATGRPAGSATCTETASCPAGAMRTRRAVAPWACRDMPFQENGSRASAVSARAVTCSAASSSAGCRPKRRAASRWSSGRATSAKSSSPRRQAVRRPWKAGPYPKPAAAQRS